MPSDPIRWAERPSARAPSVESECIHEDSFLHSSLIQMLYTQQRYIQQSLVHPWLGMLENPRVSVSGDEERGDTRFPKTPSRKGEKVASHCGPFFSYQGTTYRVLIHNRPLTGFSKTSIISTVATRPDYESGTRQALLSTADILAMGPAVSVPGSALVPLAHQTIAEIMVSDANAPARLAAAESVLDRWGTPKRKEIVGGNTMILNFAPEAAAKAIQAMATVFSPKEAPIDVLPSVPSGATAPAVLSSGALP